MRKCTFLLVVGCLSVYVVIKFLTHDYFHLHMLAWPLSVAMKRKRASAGAAKEKFNEAESSQELGPSFADLPSHITAHILLPLPIKSLLICKCVCKNWKALISDPHFAKLHFDRAPVSLMLRTKDYKRVSRTLHLLPEISEIECNHLVKLEPRFKLPLRDAKSILEKKEEIKNKSARPLRAAKLVLEKRDDDKNEGSRQRPYIACKPDHDKFNVVNSCNGLLCLSAPLHARYQIPIVICNPVTGEFIRLPEAPATRTTFNTCRLRANACFGFGFQPKTNEYKVIQMWMRHVKPANGWEYDLESVVLEIHTLGTSTWRNVEVDPGFGSSISRLEFLTCVNGALHWISRHRSILCFNFESERFESFPSPPHVFENNRRIDGREHISMGELGGFLYICDTFSFHDVTMWVMKKYGVGESWTKVYSIDTLGSPMHTPDLCYGLCLPVKRLEEGAAILLYHSYNCFIYYEPEKFGFKVFQLHGTQSESVEVIPHTPSLISLKDVVKGDNIEVLNIHSRCGKLKLREENEVLSLAQEIVYADLISFSSSVSVVILN